MKILRYGIFVLLFVTFAWADTIKLGRHTFYSEDGPINIAVVTGVAVRNLDKPYVMFMLYMGADQKIDATITRESIVLNFDGKEYRMPSQEELRKNYSRDISDMSMYRSMNLAPLALSKMRYYRFQTTGDFFPDRSQRTIPVSQGSMAATVGFWTRAYFKNPGLKKGDSVYIQVTDKDDNEIWGAVAMEIGDN